METVDIRGPRFYYHFTIIPIKGATSGGRGGEHDDTHYPTGHFIY